MTQLMKDGKIVRMPDGMKKADPWGIRAHQDGANILFLCGVIQAAEKSGTLLTGIDLKKALAARNGYPTDSKAIRGYCGYLFTYYPANYSHRPGFTDQDNPNQTPRKWAEGSRKANAPRGKYYDYDKKKKTWVLLTEGEKLLKAAA